MKKLLSLILCVSLAFTMAVPAFAGCDDDETPLPRYLSGLNGLAYEELVTFGSAAEKVGYTTDQRYIVGGDTGDDTDLNNGCGGGSYFIRLMQSRSDNKSDAITGLIAVYTSKKQAGEDRITVDGITYDAVAGYLVLKGNTTKERWSFYKDPFSFNLRKESSESKNEVYLYYTKDTRAGAPITSLEIIRGESHANDSNLVMTTSGTSCDFNKGYGGNYMFIKVNRESNSAASVFNTTASVVTISVCVVIILGVMGFVIIKKRNKSAD